MQPAFPIFLAVAYSLASTCSSDNRKPTPQKVYCPCDSLKANAIANSRDFNRKPEYDTSSFDMINFFQSDSVNRMLWFRDVENTDATKFTALWNDYYPAAYHASHPDFVKYYEGKRDIELAFQFGPNLDLWAYHIFVIKKMDCCFLLTRSYFRHARFTYKAYSIINERQLDSLYYILDRINKFKNSYLGYFVDNRRRNTYFIDLETVVVAPKTRKETRKELQALYDFVDKGINWKKTYRL
jgi:hypothetical protein